MDNSINLVQVQYCDHNSILVINPVGLLKRVFVPFRVVAKDSSNNKRRYYIVDEVRSTQKDELVYLIGGKPYYHFYFTIDVRF